MPAFAVFIREEPIDQSAMDIYRASTAPTFEGREVTRRVGYGAL